MTMQLFSFGHPCEHQLRRTCIGGSSCPLHGYPDAWCCSFVKGKINFKRDKPCEGPRCRWGFTHPTQAQFDAVTQVIAEGKAIATKLDESGPNDLLQFQIDSSHIVDTVQCALHVMKHPPSSCGKKIGQLLAYAAVKSQEPKVFTQLLKTMKKPIDSYLLGAYEFLTNQKPQPAAAGGKKSGNSSTTKSKDDVIEDLKSDIVDVMNAALSQGGQLVVREDQLQLQSVFIAALKTFPKNRKKQDMLEAAQAKFKVPPPGALAPPLNIDTPELPPATPPSAASKGQTATTAAATERSKTAEVARPAPVDEGAKPLPVGASPKQASAAAPAAAASSPAPAPPTTHPAAVPRKVIGISRCSAPNPLPLRKYSPLQPVDHNKSELLILGGLFGVSASAKSILGPASCVGAPSTHNEDSPLRLFAEGVAVATASADAAGGGGMMGFSIFGSEPIVGASAAFSQADRSLLEGVMHAWGQ